MGNQAMTPEQKQTILDAAEAAIPHHHRVLVLRAAAMRTQCTTKACEMDPHVVVAMLFSVDDCQALYTYLRANHYAIHGGFTGKRTFASDIMGVEEVVHAIACRAGSLYDSCFWCGVRNGAESKADQTCFCTQYGLLSEAWLLAEQTVLHDTFPCAAATVCTIQNKFKLHTRRASTLELEDIIDVAKLLVTETTSFVHKLERSKCMFPSLGLDPSPPSGAATTGTLAGTSIAPACGGMGEGPRIDVEMDTDEEDVTSAM